MVKYNFTPSLLDGFTQYKKYKNAIQLLNRINRVPFESEAADKGTAFNEVIDCIVEGRKSTKIDIHSEGEVRMAIINGRQFAFSKERAKSIATPLKENKKHLYQLLRKRGEKLKEFTNLKVNTIRRSLEVILHKSWQMQLKR